MNNLPELALSVILISDEQGRILLDYNDDWKAFTLPMSRIHDIPADTPGAAPAPESPLAAAVRAAAEVLGRPLPPGKVREVKADVPPYHKSLRDGHWKRYKYHLFALSISGTGHPLPGHTAVWLTRSDMEGLEPISPTVAVILNAVSV